MRNQRQKIALRFGRFPTPQPLVERVQEQENLEEGGISKGGEVWLRGFTKSNNSRDRLETATFEGDTERYWVIGSSHTQTLCYTTFKVVENLLTYDVQILLYKVSKKGRYTHLNITE